MYTRTLSHSPSPSVDKPECCDDSLRKKLYIFYFRNSNSSKMSDNSEKDESTQSDQNVETPPKKKRKVSSTKESNATILQSAKPKKKKFVDGWFTNPCFKHWIGRVDTNINKAKCLKCNVVLTADSSVLKKHMQTEDHVGNMKENIVPKIDMYLKSASSMKNELEVEVKTAEIILAGFFAEHDVSFLGFDHITPVLKKMFPDSQIAQKMKVGRTKGTEIIKNVIGETEKCQLTEKLKKKKFSVLTDEATDISTVKTSCVLVRYHDEKAGCIVSKFWDLCQVLEPGKATKATGEHLYQLIIASLAEREIPKENFIGFGSDGCNVMMGEHNSVASRLKRDFPGIIIMKCICHSLAICASNACEKLPSEPENLAKAVYSYFSSSAKRQCEFYEFQKFTETEVHRLLQPSQTRWLSLGAVVDRLIEQWNALKLFFNDQHFVQKIRGAGEIYKQLNNPSNKLFLLFLHWVLPIITRANLFFQSSKVVVTELHEVMSNLYKTLLQSYMKDQHVQSTSLSKINPEDETKFKSLNTIYLGSDIIREISKPEIRADTKLLDYFYHHARKFLIQVCVDIKARYEFDNPVMEGMKIFKQKIALSAGEREKVPSLTEFLLLLPRVCAEGKFQDVDTEWRLLPFHKFDETDAELKNMEIDKFWNKMYFVKNEGGEYLFRNLAESVLAILSLPHSNCDSERIFSKLNRVKTKDRNKTIVPTIRGVLLASQNVKSSGQCINFNPSSEMLSRMTKDSLYTKSKNVNTKEYAKENIVTEEDEEDDFMFEK